MFWPTAAALASALFTMILSAMVLFAYCWGTDTADKMDNWKGYFTKFTVVVHAIFYSVVAASMFITQNNPNSLNQQTCSPAADAKAPLFPQINLGSFCLKQVNLLSILSIDC